MQADRCPMVFYLLREAIRQASKSAHAHSHRQVLTLDHAVRNMVLGWQAFQAERCSLMSDLSERLANRVQLSSDALNSYVDA